LGGAGVRDSLRRVPERVVGCLVEDAALIFCVCAGGVGGGSGFADVRCSAAGGVLE
jgi:hypothetical protein